MTWYNQWNRNAKIYLILIWNLIISNYFPESSDIKTESISFKSRSLDEKILHEILWIGIKYIYIYKNSIDHDLSCRRFEDDLHSLHSK